MQSEIRWEGTSFSNLHAAPGWSGTLRFGRAPRTALTTNAAEPREILLPSPHNMSKVLFTLTNRHEIWSYAICAISSPSPRKTQARRVLDGKVVVDLDEHVEAGRGALPAKAAA